MWFSSPDPSTNHILLCGAQHQGTANWFFQGSLFEDWKSSGSLLWIYGKHMSFNIPRPPGPDVTYLHSGLREKRPLVRSFSCFFIFSRDLNYLLALRSSGISRICARLDWLRWLTITSTSGILTNRIAETYSSPFFLSFLLALILAVICSTAYT